MNIFLGLDLHLNVKKKQDLKVAAGAPCRPLPLKTKAWRFSLKSPALIPAKHLNKSRFRIANSLILSFSSLVRYRTQFWT